MKKLVVIPLIVLLFSGCGSLNSAFDPSFLLKNPWVVQSILGNKVDVSSFANGLPFVEFLSGGKVSGFDGCNNFNGEVKMDAKSLSFGPLASTKKMCSGVDSDAFTSALNQVTGFTRNGDLLELTGKAGTLLSFLPKNAE